jgi:acyl carrier protein
MPSSDAELRRLIIEWLDDQYHFGDAESLIKDDAQSFLETGVLTSLGFVQLVLFLERRLAIRIERGALTRENFDGMGKIIAFVRRCEAEQAS